MSLTRKLMDRLPPWVHILLMVLAIPLFILGLMHEGWWFLLRVLFSPEL